MSYSISISGERRLTTLMQQLLTAQKESDKKKMEKKNKEKEKYLAGKISGFLE